jgi:hypothetical protein
MSIVCIVVFIMCFAVGLGPIPFIYVAECFKQDARGAALAICMLSNWVANLLLTLAFEYLAKVLTDYVFIVFTLIVGLAVFLIIFKVKYSLYLILWPKLEVFSFKLKKTYSDRIRRS